MGIVAPGHAEGPFVLTIDVGSSSSRVLLFDRHGNMVDGIGAQLTYTIRRSSSGVAELNPDDLLNHIEQCIGDVLKQTGSLADSIAAVAPTTLVSNIMAIDTAGRPLTPLITYADTRATADATMLRRQLDEAQIRNRTGCPLRVSYWPAWLAWFRRTQPEVWRTAAQWLSFGEYLELRLLGRSRVSLSVASWSGLLDRTSLIWDRPLLEATGITDDQLSPIVDNSESQFDLLAPYAEQWPSLRRAVWFPAIGDGAAATVGSGCTNHERAAITIGTSGAIRVIEHGLSQVPEGLWCYRVDRRRMLLGGATSEGGNVYAWMRRSLRLTSAKTIDQAVEALPPDGHGLTILPFFAGERSPGWAGDIPAVIAGLRLTTTPLEIIRAGLEGIAYRIAIIAQQMCHHPASMQHLVASGGALLRSPSWMQIFADVLNRPLVASAEPESSSRGAALLALEALRQLPSIRAAPASDGRIYQPDPAHHERYVQAIARQQQLYQALVGGAAGGQVNV